MKHVSKSVCIYYNNKDIFVNIFPAFLIYKIIYKNSKQNLRIS